MLAGRAVGVRRERGGWRPAKMAWRSGEAAGREDGDGGGLDNRRRGSCMDEVTVSRLLTTKRQPPEVAI